MPFFYDVYQGNRNDARQFSEVLQRFHRFFSDLSGREGVVPATTLIFDKGNNSAANFRLLDELKLKFVGSVKHKEHPELAAIPHTDRRFLACSSPGLKGVKAFRVTKTVAAPSGSWSDLQPEAGTHSMADLAERHYQGQPAAGRTARAAG